MSLKFLQAVEVSPTTGEVLKLGNNTSAASTNPVSFDMGGSHSSVAGQNLKLKVFDSGVSANEYGFGVSASQLDYVVPSTADHAWWVGTAKIAEINAAGLYLKAISASEGGKINLSGAAGYADWMMDSLNNSMRIFSNSATKTFLNVFNAGAGDVDTYFTGLIYASESITGKVLRTFRNDSISEGGQIDLARSSDDATAWSLDVHGAGSNPDLRFIRNSATVPVSLGVLSATDSEEVLRVHETLSTQSIKRAYEVVVSAAGTKTLSLHNNYLVIITGTTTHTVALPSWTSGNAPDGKEFIIKNRSTGNVTVTVGSGGLIDGSASNVTLTTNQVLHVIYCLSLNGYVKVN